MRVQRYVGREIGDTIGRRIQLRAIPTPILALWCSTGARYLAENTFYPIATIILHHTAISLGWISVLAVVAGVLFGKLSDKLNSHALVLLPVCAITIGWFARSFELTFGYALFFL